MSYALGIDLGTTNSVVSIVKRGVPETILIDGKTKFPSVVSFRQDGGVLVGAPAKNRLLLDPDNSVSSAKRFMGDRSKSYHVGGRTLSPVDVSSLILKRLVEGARSVIGEDVWDAVITVPAYFTDAQREDTKRAGQEAGLNVLRLLPEPTSAALAYGAAKGKDQTIMVYDLGGGTFDVSILEIKGNRFEVKAVGGDAFLGGDDFDEAIMNWMAVKLRERTGINVMDSTSREARIARQRMKESAENAKIELSVSSHANIAMTDILGSSLDVTISVDEFKVLIKPYLDKTVACMRSVLKDAGLDAEDIDRVILVGGSTKIPAVRETVAREIKDPYTSERVDEVVSHGAAILAANLFLPEEAVPVQLSDVTAHSLGVDLLDEYRDLIFQPIISRQTPYPCSAGYQGTTVYPYQKGVEMGVFRGEDRNPKRNQFLGKLEMQVSPPQSELVPIVAIFELDADGIIHFTAVQLPTNDYSQSILAYAADNNGKVDVGAVMDLVNNGMAKSKTISVKAV